MLHVKEIFIDVKWPNIEQLIWPSGHTERRRAKRNVKGQILGVKWLNRRRILYFYNSRKIKICEKSAEGVV